MENRITITEMMTRARALKERGERFTLLGIGPMSSTLITAAMELGQEKRFPLLLIASRNQVDGDARGGGYVCGYDQKRFRARVEEAAGEAGFDGLCYLCRDHGGPWQRDEERTAKLPAEQAMAIAEESYIEDMESGFDLLHIDPTKDPHIDGTVPLELVLERTVQLIERIERERRKRNFPELAYEVGTEETNGGLTSAEAFGNFAKQLVQRLEEKGLPRPVFIVGQTGTLTRLTTNVGQYNTGEARVLTELANRYGMGLKEHNGDYLSNEILLEHPVLTLDAMNVAPEFGLVETRAYFELAAVEEKFLPEGKRSGLREVIRRHAVQGQRWRKWMMGEARNATVEAMLADKEQSALIAEICGHYTLEDPEVKAALAALKKNVASLGLDATRYAVKRIKDSIDRYAACFNLYDLTDKILGVR